MMLGIYSQPFLDKVKNVNTLVKKFLNTNHHKNNVVSQKVDGVKLDRTGKSRSMLC